MLTWYQAIACVVAPAMLLYQFHPRASRYASALFGLTVGLTLVAFLGVRL